MSFPSKPNHFLASASSFASLLTRKIRGLEGKGREDEDGGEEESRYTVRRDVSVQ